MRILITGANGFVGKHLVSELAKRNHQVFACMRHDKDAFHKPVTNVYLDILDNSKLFETIERIKPEGIIHLAAQSMVKAAWEDPTKTLFTNVTSTTSLVEAVKRFVPLAKVIIVGSSEEYGITAKLGEPLTEEHDCIPQNPYATSKWVAGQLALQLAKIDQLNLIHVRPFNHFGPGQREGFVISDFASQVARIESFMSPPIIKVGDLSAKRDFTDVRDVVNAYINLLEREVSSGVYNICSGAPVIIKDILEHYVAHSKIPIEVEIDKARFRPSEVPLFIGSSQKLQQATGWKPIRNFQESLTETLAWWRTKVEA